MSKLDMHRYMRVGIVHCMLFPETLGGDGPVVETLERICSDPYFESVEITRVNDPGMRAAVARMLEVAGMEVGFAAQPIQLGEKLDLGSADEAERQRAVERLRRAAEMARELGAHKFALMSGPDPGEDGREAALRRTAESLLSVCAHARKLGMRVALEVFDREIDKKALVGSTYDAVRLAARVRAEYPDFGLMLDLSHLPLQGETSREALTIARGYITHIHIGNCVLRPEHPNYGDTHPPFGIKDGENGVEELAEFLQVLFDTGYLGAPGPVPTVAFEVRPRPGESSELVLANAKRTLQAAWRMVA